MVDLTTLALRYLQLYGPIALLVFTFLETSMLFPFLPSEIVVPAAAAILISGPASFLVFVLTATVGGTAGAFVPFYVFHRGQRREFTWIRDRIHVGDEDIERGREWFRKWGSSSVLWGRFLPVLRSVVSIPAGFARMTPARFGAYTATGTVGFYVAIGAVVYYSRRQSLFAAARTVAADRPVLTAGVLLGVLVIGLLVGAWYRRQ